MDQIRSKLNQLDKKLEGFGGLVKERISASPILFIAVGLILGVIVQSTINVPLWCWCVFLGFLFSAALILFYHLFVQSYRGNIKNPVSLAMAVLLCAFCLGAIRLITYRQAAPNNIRNFVKDKPILATIRGTVISEPYVNNNENWKFAKFSHSDPTTSFYLKLTQAESVDGWDNVTGVVRVQVSEPVIDLKVADSIEAYCFLDRFSQASNPGQFSIARYLANSNIYISARIEVREAITILNSAKSGYLLRFLCKIKQIARELLLGDVETHQSNLAMLDALVLGNRADIDAKTYRAFEKTGLLHLVSLSGMNLGILAAVVWGFCRILGLLKPVRAIVCIITVGLFLMVVPPRAPIIRAGVICFVFCLSILFRRKADSLNSLSLAAVVLLLIKPTDLFEAGWQLSFATVLGLIVIYTPLYSFLKEHLISKSFYEDTSGLQMLKRFIVVFITSILAGLTTGIVASISSSGILLYNYYAINPLAGIWTVLVSPMVTGIVIIGLIKILLSSLFPTVSVFLGVVLQLINKVLIWSVTILSKVNLSEILVGQVPLWFAICYYVLVILFLWIFIRSADTKKSIIAVLIALAVGIINVTALGIVGKNNLELTCLDVGHGQAVILQTPKHCFIFDAGSQHSKDIGTRIIKPFLRHDGIKQIDAIIISHDDVDHINGIPEIAAGCPIKAVYSNLAFINKSNEWGTAKYLIDFLAEKGLAIKPLAEKLYSDKNLNISILWPDEDTSKDENVSDNNKSTVSLIEFAGRKILICSDIEDVAQQRLLSRFKNLTADIVIAPHHGSKNTTADEFLKSLNAQYLICSSGQRYYQRLQNTDNKAAGEWFYTAKDGAVSVRISKKGQIEANGFISE